MPDNILQRMRNKSRSGDYVMTLHAEEEMDAEGLSIFDAERAVLTGKIIERQKVGQTGEIKYRVLGSMVDGNLMEVVVNWAALEVCS